MRTIKLFSPLLIFSFCSTLLVGDLYCVSEITSKNKKGQDTEIFLTVEVKDAADRTTPRPDVLVYMHSHQTEDGTLKPESKYEWTDATNPEGIIVTTLTYYLFDEEGVYLSASLTGYEESDGISGHFVNVDFTHDDILDYGPTTIADNEVIVINKTLTLYAQ